MIGIDLRGRKALVCGAGGGGLGTAVSLALAEAGADLIAVDQNAEQAEDTRAAATALGVACNTIVADLTDRNQVVGLVDRALAKAGHIDVVVNVAGGTRLHQWSPIEETSEENFRDVLALNLDYVFRVNADAARSMIAAKRPGTIINFASISAHSSAPFHGPYGIAKRGLMAMTETMAIEWARYGIRVNTVAPGGVASPRATASYAGSREAGDLSLADGLRIMKPSEVAAVVAFLASDLASGISGQTIAVDSGISAKNPSSALSDYQRLMDSARESAKR
jgi:NAD(P)-dependent dehydrogenase (short-subunit alcohol dehydrogenase family)